MTSAATSADAATPPTSEVRIVDVATTRVRRSADLVALCATIAGIALVLLMGVYAQGTTAGITEDVREIADLARRILVVPFNVLSGLVSLVVPVVVLVDIALRKEPRRIIEVIAASVLGFVSTLVAVYTTQNFGSYELVHSLSVGSGDDVQVSLPAFIAALAAMLTTAGRRSSRRSLAVAWNIIWFALALAVISGIVTLPAILVTMLIGRGAGLLMRYLFGSNADRAYGKNLVEAIRRAGFNPRELVRAPSQSGRGDVAVDPVVDALGRTRPGRVYAMTTEQNHRLVVVAMDGDRQAAGGLARYWNALRLRGLDARAVMSLRSSAETVTLASHAARAAGVRTARVMGIAQSRDTMVIIYQQPSGCVPIAQIAPEDVSDAMLDAVWAEVVTMHDAGISHRNLSADTIFIGGESHEPIVWLSAWELGEVATSEVARRIDRAQIMSMMGILVGPERAVESAFRVLDPEEIQRTAPLLQPIVLPRATRSTQPRIGKLLQDTRSQISDHFPDATIARENITRFGMRTVLMLTVAVFAGWLILTYFNAAQVWEAVQSASLWWIAVAFVWSLAAFAGASLTMLAFSPVRLPPVRVFIVQVAASYIALVAPAGVGPAALNMRMLTRRAVATPLALATVALVQVSGIVVTVTALLLLSFTTGSSGTLAVLPSAPILIVVASVAVLLTALLLVPKMRAWAVARIMPMIRQTGPRFLQIVGQPWRLGTGLGGNLLLTISYVGAFYACLRAFGQHLELIDVAILFLLGNAAGAIIPTPGGLGTVEFTLIAGLTAASVPTAIATSVVLLYRFITYWIRIPMGYAAMKYSQKAGEI